MYPIYKSFDSKSNQERSPSRVLDTESLARLSMESVLIDPSYAVEKESFLAHAMKEFSVEQVLFYEAASEFAAHAGEWDDNMLCTKAMEVYDTFIRQEADQEVCTKGAAKHR